MADINYYRLHSGYTTEYGTFVGISWIVVFALYVGGIILQSGLFMTVGMFLFCALPTVPFYFARRFRHQLPDDMTLGFGRAYWFSLIMLVYATILTAAAVFVYFRWMDQGTLLQAINDIVDNPLSQQTYEDMHMGDTLKMMKQVLKDLASLTPFDIAVSFFNQNFVFSLLLAFPTALFAKKNKSTHQ